MPVPPSFRRGESPGSPHPYVLAPGSLPVEVLWPAAALGHKLRKDQQRTEPFSGFRCLIRRRAGGCFLGLTVRVTEPSVSSVLISLRRALAGRYDVERELGAGGMGQVLLGRDVALDRPVAIKVIAPDLASSAASRQRFLREARTVARLRHPN